MAAASQNYLQLHTAPSAMDLHYSLPQHIADPVREGLNWMMTK